MKKSLILSYRTNNCINGTFPELLMEMLFETSRVSCVTEEPGTKCCTLWQFIFWEEKRQKERSRDKREARLVVLGEELWEEEIFQDGSRGLAFNLVIHSAHL